MMPSLIYVSPNLKITPSICLLFIIVIIKNFSVLHLLYLFPTVPVQDCKNE